MFELILLIWQKYNEKYVLDDNHFLRLTIYRNNNLEYYLYNVDETYRVKLDTIGLDESILEDIEYSKLNTDDIQSLDIQLCKLEGKKIIQYWTEIFNVNSKLEVRLESNWVMISQLESISSYILNNSNLDILNRYRICVNWEFI